MPLLPATIPSSRELDLDALSAETDALIAANAAVLEAARDEMREITVSERNEIRARNAEIDDRERQRLLGLADAGARRRTEPAPLDSRAPEAGPHDESAWPAAARDRSWRGLFGANVSRSGWKSGQEFIHALAAGRHDPRFVMATANESEGAAGGFLVPQPMMQQVMDAALKREIVRPRCRNFAMTAASVRIPSLDWTDLSDGTTVANLGLEWLPELGAGTTQRPKIRSQTLVAHRAAIYSQASIELVEDAPAFYSTLLDGFAASTARGLDYSFLWGTGAGQPQGLLTSANPARVVVDELSGQTADSLAYENAISMFSRMLPSSVNNAVWLAHPSTVPALLTFNISGGSLVGSTVVPAITMQPDGTFLLIGRPVIISDLMKPIGDEGDFAFVDLDYFGIGIRKQAGIERNLAPGWSTYAEDYRLILRTDGASLLNAVVTPPWSAATLAPFVLLGARA